MPTFPLFSGKNEGEEEEYQTALKEMEACLREELQNLAEHTARKFHSLEKRIEVLEKKQEVTSRTSASLNDRVSNLEGILKKAEEAGKARQRRQRVAAIGTGGNNVGASAATATRARSRSRSRTMSRSHSGRLSSSDDGHTDATGNHVKSADDDSETGGD